MITPGSGSVASHAGSMWAWSGNGYSVMSRPSVRSESKKRSGREMPATAASRCPAMAATKSAGVQCWLPSRARMPASSVRIWKRGGAEVRGPSGDALVLADWGDVAGTSSASTWARRSAGSRSGPAGRQRPLPRPSGCIITSSSRRGRATCCSPSSEITTSRSGWCETRRSSAALRRAPTPTGRPVSMASSRASSPASAAGVLRSMRRGVSEEAR